MSKLTIIIGGTDMKEWEARFKCSWIWQYEVETHEMNSTPNVRPHDIGKLMFEWINDRVPMRKMTCIWFGLVAVSHIILANTGAAWFNSFWAQAANILYSLGGPICTLGPSLYGIELAISGDTKAWIRNYLVVYNIGGLVFTQLAGIIADKTGNYSAIFYMLAVCGVVGAVFSQLAYSGAYKEAKKG